jgi:hypothetical protein
MPNPALAALLQVTGLVRNQHPVGVAEMSHHKGAEVVADCLGVPAGLAQQPLHRVRSGMTGRLGQSPAGLARHVRQQPEQEIPSRAPQLHPGEAARDPAGYLVE